VLPRLHIRVEGLSSRGYSVIPCLSCTETRPGPADEAVQGPSADWHARIRQARVYASKVNRVMSSGKVVQANAFVASSRHRPPWLQWDADAT
jgi:hypothetical protein